MPIQKIQSIDCIKLSFSLAHVWLNQVWDVCLRSGCAFNLMLKLRARWYIKYSVQSEYKKKDNYATCFLWSPRCMYWVASLHQPHTVLWFQISQQETEPLWSLDKLLRQSYHTAASSEVPSMLSLGRRRFSWCLWDVDSCHVNVMHVLLFCYCLICRLCISSSIVNTAV